MSSETIEKNAKAKSRAAEEPKQAEARDEEDDERDEGDDDGSVDDAATKPLSMSEVSSAEKHVIDPKAPSAPANGHRADEVAVRRHVVGFQADEGRRHGSFRDSLESGRSLEGRMRRQIRHSGVCLACFSEKNAEDLKNRH